MRKGTGSAIAHLIIALAILLAMGVLSVLAFGSEDCYADDVIFGKEFSIRASDCSPYTVAGQACYNTSNNLLYIGNGTASNTTGTIEAMQTTLLTPGTDKVLNGADWTGATGATPPTSWSVVTAGTFTITGSGQAGNYLLITHDGSHNYPAITQAVQTLAGHQYKVTFYFKKGTAAGGKVYVGTTSGGSQLYTSGLLANVSWTQHSFMFVATTATTYVTLTNYTSTNAQTSGFDTVTLTEIDTMIWNSGDKDIASPSSSTDYTYYRAFSARTLSRATMFVTGGTSVVSVLQKCSNIVSDCVAISDSLTVNAGEEGEYLDVTTGGTLNYAMVPGDRIVVDITTVNGGVTRVTIALEGTIP